MLMAACVVPCASARAGKALQVRHHQEGLHRVDIQRAHAIINFRYD